MPFGISKSSRSEDEEAEEALGGNGTETAAADDIQSEEEVAVADSPPAEDKPEDGGEAYRRMSFRPDYLDDASPREQTPVAVARAPHADAFFVAVTRGDASQVHRFEGAADAQTFVESLLEEGVPQDDVATFSGRRLAFSVSHRPVVKLVSSQEE